MDPIPPTVIGARYFADERAKLDELASELESASAAVTEHAEEHGVDEALLSDATNDKGAYTKQLLTDGIKTAKAAQDDETFGCANEALKLLNAEAAAKKAVMDAQAKLDLATLKTYRDLTEYDVKEPDQRRARPARPARSQARWDGLDTGSFLARLDQRKGGPGRTASVGGCRIDWLPRRRRTSCSTRTIPSSGGSGGGRRSRRPAAATSRFC